MLLNIISKTKKQEISRLLVIPYMVLIIPKYEGKVLVKVCR